MKINIMKKGISALLAVVSPTTMYAVMIGAFVKSHHPKVICLIQPSITLTVPLRTIQ